MDDLLRGDAPRLQHFTVERLFDEFDYKIPIKLEERITALIAPNGSGKTACLRLIDALFRRQWSVFRTTNFRSATYTFSNGFTVRVVKGAEVESEEDAPNAISEIRIYIHQPSALFDKAEPILWQAPGSKELQQVAVHASRYIPMVTQMSSNRWVHDHSGQVYNAMELVESFAGMFPASIVQTLRKDEPSSFAALIDSIDCHLIETQRLLILGSDDRVPYRGTRREISTLAISQKATSLKEIISRTLVEYGTLSQSLDRSFPKRVIEQTGYISQDEIKTRLRALDELRKQLIEAGILSAEGSDPVGLPAGDITSQIASVLSVYAEDTQRKLNSLSPLLNKVRLFKDLIEERFVRKKIHIDPKMGFRVTINGNNVPIDKLSSGEQHQLVLYFELLFQLKSNALILIDEPELSLHVAWQRKFIPDLIRIIELNKFDVVLATHSPQLISHWDDLVVELGEVDAP
jgi:ABC-type lipoprotein export system ATPase subunit